MQKKSNVKMLTSADSSRFEIKIGSVLYQIAVHFKQDAAETLETKIFRLVKSELEVAA